MLYLIILSLKSGSCEMQAGKKDCPEEITPMEEDNSQCDSDTEDCIVDGDDPTPFQPLPGYVAMLQLNGRWITTQFRNCVKFAIVAPPVIEYIKGRLNIDEKSFHTINWVSVGKVCTYHLFSRKVQTSKMMYRWLPIGHNCHKCKLETDKCP